MTPTKFTDEGQRPASININLWIFEGLGTWDVVISDEAECAHFWPGRLVLVWWHPLGHTNHECVLHSSLNFLQHWKYIGLFTLEAKKYKRSDSIVEVPHLLQLRSQGSQNGIVIEEFFKQLLIGIELGFVVWRWRIDLPKTLLYVL